jgi:hypothetical protein
MFLCVPKPTDTVLGVRLVSPVLEELCDLQPCLRETFVQEELVAPTLGFVGSA